MSRQRIGQPAPIKYANVAFLLVVQLWGVPHIDAFAQQAPFAQEPPAKGVVTISFRPDGFSGMVTIDVPKDGVADARPELIFLLQDVPKDFIQVIGTGTVELVRQGVLHVQIDKTEQIVFVKNGVSDADANVRPGVRLIRVGEIFRGWARPTSRETRGAAGTGTVTQERIDEAISPRKK